MGRAARIKRKPGSQPAAGVRVTLLIERANEALRSGNRPAAIVLLRQVLIAAPDHAAAHLNLATALREQGDLTAAIAQYERLLAVEPGHLAGLVNLGETLRRAGRHREALAVCDRALALDPRHEDGHLIRGVIRQELGDRDGGATDLLVAIAVNPANAAAYRILGRILMPTPRQDEALAAFREAVRLAPADAQSHRLAGDVCDALGRVGESFEAYRRAMELDPHDLFTYANLSGLLCKTKLLDVALNVTDVGLKLAPDMVELHLHRALALEKLDRLEPALAAYAEALRCDPTSARALMSVCRLKAQTCDWAGLDVLETRAKTLALSGAQDLPPFSILSIDASLAEIQACNRRWSRAFDRGHRPLATYAPRPDDRRHERLRIGYLSADFHSHATAALIAELFELHDRSLFETWGYSIGAHSEDAMRRRLVAALDHFHDLTDLSHDDAAASIRAHEIDILIDLKGYTFQARTEILARRPAPVQVNFLGYPSTMGTHLVDYIIGDAEVTPFAHAPYYDEAIVQLPHSYQPNDRKRPIAAATPTHRDCGLPDDAFVFCCFNAAYKITAPVFEIWMGVLRDVPRSVLWLYESGPSVPAKLRREADARGVDPSRIVFAPKRPPADHIARMRLGDLFLDTSPYGAHTTASEALWSGLPVVTLRGTGFASRVGASLAIAVDLPELVADSWPEYAAIARHCAEDPSALARLRVRLARNRATAPLFDSVRYTRDFERALVEMATLRDRGAKPAAFRVASSD